MGQFDPTYNGRWSPRDETNLKELADECTPAPIICLKLRRSEDAIRAKASEMGLGLAPAARY